MPLPKYEVFGKRFQKLGAATKYARSLAKGRGENRPVEVRKVYYDSVGNETAFKIQRMIQGAKSNPIPRTTKGIVDLLRKTLRLERKHPGKVRVSVRRKRA